MKEKIKLYVLLLIKLSNLSVLLYLEIFLKEEQKKCLFYLKKTYQNPFVELYYEQKNATVIGWRELCERGLSDSMQEIMLRIYMKNYCKTKYPSRITDDVLCAGTDKEGKSMCKIMRDKSLPSLLLTSRFTTHINESITSLYIYLYTRPCIKLLCIYTCVIEYLSEKCAI